MATLAGVFNQNLSERVQLHLLNMTLVAKQPTTERIATLRLLIAQAHIALLTTEALNMEILLHRDQTYRFTGALGRHDHLSASGTPWRVLLVIVLDTIDVVLDVECERQAVQAIITVVTAETAWVVGLADRLQDHVNNHVSAD